MFSGGPILTAFRAGSRQFSAAAGISARPICQYAVFPVLKAKSAAKWQCTRNYTSSRTQATKGSFQHIDTRSFSRDNSLYKGNPSHLLRGPRNHSSEPLRVSQNTLYRSYSTKSAPPPPPPPPTSHDKNAKGKAILNRVSRVFTFSFSSLLVVGALAIAILVLYLILSELFLPSGDTKTFNKAVKLVEQHTQAQQALQLEPGRRLKAYGETAGDKWVRNRPVQSIRSKGKDGNDHLVMKFHVESDAGRHGTVTLEQIDTSFWSLEFAYVALDVRGSKRIYIIEPKFQARNYVPRQRGLGFLGLKWGPKKDD